MKNFITAGAFVVLFFFLPSVSATDAEQERKLRHLNRKEDESDDTPQNIVGGSLSESPYPFFVHWYYLDGGTRMYCSGSLVHDDIVLTRYALFLNSLSH